MQENLLILIACNLYPVTDKTVLIISVKLCNRSQIVFETYYTESIAKFR